MKACTLMMMFTLLVASVAGPVHASTHSAVDVVRNTSTQVIQQLKSEKKQLAGAPEKVYELINEEVVPHFDFTSMSRWVLGNAWNQASEQQRREFVEQFKTLLVRTYGNALMEYSNNEIVYHPEQSSPNSKLVLVRTEVKGVKSGSAIPIHYRMHNVDGKWKVVDVAVDGVSLVSTYRGSFTSEIRKSGLDALIDKLVQRNTGT